MYISEPFGCGVATISGFNSDPWGTGGSLRDQLDAHLRSLKRAYTRKLIAVVTDGQPEALEMLKSHPRARLLTKAMNYRYMNYIFAIDTDNFIGPEPVEHRMPFRKTIITKNRKGSRAKIKTIPK